MNVGDLSTCVHCRNRMEYSDPGSPNFGWALLEPDANGRYWRCSSNSLKGHEPSAVTPTPDLSGLNQEIKGKLAQFLIDVWAETRDNSVAELMLEDGLREILGREDWIKAANERGFRI